MITQEIRNFHTVLPPRRWQRHTPRLAKEKQIAVKNLVRLRVLAFSRQIATNQLLRPPTNLLTLRDPEDFTE